MTSPTQNAGLKTGRSENVRIAVISDLHAYDRCRPEEKSAPSHLCTLDDDSHPGTHPITGLKQLITQEHLEADALLCPGDLGDKANHAGISYGWRAVNEIGKLLTVRLLAGTVGNHDIDSRYNFSDFDLKGHLQSLSPPFPLSAEDDNDRFWSRNFVVFDESLFRLVVLNSSAFHGGKNVAEIDHGRISAQTLAGLTRALVAVPPKGLNILLCHHHPHKHSEIQLGEFDEMRGGQDLLDLLGCGRYGDWIVIHGHKHHPKLTYAAGGNSAPIVFSAGSLCAQLYPALGTRVRNQFYILDFPCARFAERGLIGTFRAWDWHSGLGWQSARYSGSGLPGNGGFGFRGNLTVLAGRIAQAVSIAD